jgi:GT2 family glycosyltransferase
VIDRMDLSIIIVSWNVCQLLDACLHSIRQSLHLSVQAGRPLATEIWIVDNHSSDGSVEMLEKRHPSVRLIANDDNVGFAAANNQAIAGVLDSSQPRFLLLLNPDTLVRGRALEGLAGHMSDTPQAGMAGARLVYGDGSFQHSAFAFPGLTQLALDLFPFPARLYETQLNGRYPRSMYAANAPPFPVSHPLGAAMIVRREVVETVGPLDEGYFMYCEEIDWAMRIRQAGWDIYCVPAVEIVHYGGQSSGQIKATSLVNLWRSRHRLYKKHYSPMTMRLAALMVRRAMRDRSKRVESPDLLAAYHQIEKIWSST